MADFERAPVTIEQWWKRNKRQREGLLTTAKESTVAAINEVFLMVGSPSSNGPLSAGRPSRTALSAPISGGSPVDR